MLSLRQATISDAKRLFDWRTDPATRLASHVDAEFEFASHLSWLKETLENPARILFIAEENGCPVGTVRVDYEFNDGVQLSWTIGPEFRGRKIAAHMVQLVTKSLPWSHYIRAEVKIGNEASIKVALAVGMMLCRQEGDVLHFIRRM